MEKKVKERLKKKKFWPIFPHQVQCHILAEPDNDRFQEGLGGGGCQEQLPPRNSSTSFPPAQSRWLGFGKTCLNSQ